LWCRLWCRHVSGSDRCGEGPADSFRVDVEKCFTAATAPMAAARWPDLTGAEKGSYKPSLHLLQPRELSKLSTDCRLGLRDVLLRIVFWGFFEDAFLSDVSKWLHHCSQALRHAWIFYLWDHTIAFKCPRSQRCYPTCAQAPFHLSTWHGMPLTLLFCLWWFYISIFVLGLITFWCFFSNYSAIHIRLRLMNSYFWSLPRKIQRHFFSSAFPSALLVCSEDVVQSTVAMTRKDLSLRFLCFLSAYLVKWRSCVDLSFLKSRHCIQPRKVPSVQCVSEVTQHVTKHPFTHQHNMGHD